jgi:hypothetical protein
MLAILAVLAGIAGIRARAGGAAVSIRKQLIAYHHNYNGQQGKNGDT